MKRIIVIIFALAALVIGLIGYGFSQESAPTVNSDQLQVVATFYPLAHFAQAVGRDHIQVTQPVPAGAEPHNYEPTPQDIITMTQADVFLYHGAGLDTWANKVEPDIAKHGGTAVEMSAHFTLLPGIEGSFDPHIWLDPQLAQQEIAVIRDAFISADPAHAADYTANAEKYIDALSALDRSYETGLSACKRNDVVVAHDAFSYLGARYQLNIIPIAGVSPEEEPSAQKLAELTQLVRQKGVTTIFFEELVSPKLAQTLAAETGTTTAVLNPVEGLTAPQLSAGADYLSLMEANLRQLRAALECQF